MNNDNFTRNIDPKDAMGIGDEKSRKMSSVGMLDEDIKKMSNVKFFVEANSFEIFKLWQENKNDYKEPCKWGEGHLGLIFTIGFLDNRPINIALHFATLDEILVCFYSGCSEVVDHKMIEEFIKFCWPIKYDSKSRRAMTDAHNFHHCVHFCKNPY